MTLDHNGQKLDNGFQFVRKDGELETQQAQKDVGAEGRYQDDRNIRRVKVKKSGSATVWFPIAALDVGKLNLTLTATSDAGGGDKIVRQLRVEPEGFRVEQSSSELLSLEEGQNLRRSLKMTFPETIVPGSQFAQISIIGDALGPALQNVDDLVL